MKVDKNVIQTFRLICRDELETTDKEIIYKITRNFTLGTITKILAPNTYIKKFGTLCLLSHNDKIISVFHEKENPTYANNYEKYKYDFENAKGNVNAKYSG